MLVLQLRLEMLNNATKHSHPFTWLVPALHTICRNTHVTADAADKANSRDHSKLQNAVNLLQESFSRCLNDRKDHNPGAALSEDGSKKTGVLYIVNQLFAMYFKLNTLRLCKNLLRPVESRGLHLSGDMGDVVTYRYYVGRLYMFEDQYELAESNLEFALIHCHKSASKNKKCILRYLIPVKLFRGRLPTSNCKSLNPSFDLASISPYQVFFLVIKKYELNEFKPLVNSIRTGDLRTFNDGLVKYQDLFIRYVNRQRFNFLASL
jgi:nuclear mRNA export protein PCID2/THP1